MDNTKRHLEGNEAVWWRLANRLNIHFGIGGLGGDQAWFKSAFGSVLSDLPEDVFLQLCGMRNVFFTFTPNPGPEVKHFIFDEDETENFKNWDRIIIVTFPYACIAENEMSVRGSIIHELVHLCVHSDKAASNDAMEIEADRIATEWGFGEEIREMRRFEAECD